MRTLRMAAILCTLLVAFAHAELTQEWQVNQDFYEYGILGYDYNDDGSVDLTKMWGNWVTVYDGADDYSVLWSIQASDYDELEIRDIYDNLVDGERVAIFNAYDYVDQASTRIYAYDLLADNPRWSSLTYSGYVSNITTGDIDGDNQDEVLFGTNLYVSEDEDYDSRFFVLDGATGAVEFSSSVFSGYVRGPYVDDMDGDGVLEILLNIYSYSDSTAKLIAYSDDTQSVLETEAFRPSDITLHSNFPNPFNPGTTIPISLQRRAEVTVTVYDLLGREVTVLVSGTIGAGTHQFYWNGLDSEGRRLASGTYFYEVTINGEHRLRRPMVLVK